MRPTTSVADSPSGLEFELKVPQNDDPNGLATAHLKDTRFLLPEGMRVNPSAADGLDACSAVQIGLTSKSPLRFTKLEPSCPDGAKLGTVEVRTPLSADARSVMRPVRGKSTDWRTSPDAPFSTDSVASGIVAVPQFHAPAV